MEKRRFKNGLTLPVIGQGCMGIGGEFSPDYMHDAEAIKIIQYGIDCGLTFIDTAEIYGGGHSEELIGKAISGRRDEVIISTKFSPEHASFANVLKSAEESLRRLHTDYIDLYFIHWPNPTVPINETLDAMMQLVQQGKVRWIGVSNFSVFQLKKLLGYPISAVQEEYNLFDRTVETDLLPYCVSTDVALIAYSPLNQGLILNSQLLKTIGEKYNATPAQVVLYWLTEPISVIAIPKTLNLKHIYENAQVGDLHIDEEDLDVIDMFFRNDPIDVDAYRIRVVLNGVGNRCAYQTINDAYENRLNFVPSPLELAQDILNGNDKIKPVRVRKTTDQSVEYDYDLIEGRIRYWAWVIAYNGEKPIPVLVR